MPSPQADAGRFERTAPFLGAHQVTELLNEKQAIEEALTAPSHVSAQIQNRGQMRRQISHIDRQLHNDAPKAYRQDEIDSAVKREQELRDKWTAGMPTQAEMRRSPAGAIDKHRSWERANKRDILEWKNIRRRLHATGLIDDHPDAREVSNIEQFRPVHASHELPMDNKLVAGKDIYLPPGHIEVRNVMSDADRAAMAERDRLAAENAQLRAELEAREKAAAEAEATAAAVAKLQHAKK